MFKNVLGAFLGGKCFDSRWEAEPLLKDGSRAGLFGESKTPSLDKKPGSRKAEAEGKEGYMSPRETWIH